MTQILYPDELVGTITNDGGKAPTKPLRTWYVRPIKIGDKTYYLHIEELTGYPVVTDKPDKFAFRHVMTQLINTMTFLVGKQRERMNRDITESLQYHYSPNTPLMWPQYQKIIQQHQDEFARTIQADPDVPTNLQLRDLSIQLLSLLNNDQFNLAIDTIISVMNDEVPIKANKPKAGTSYVTIQPEFRDPRFWQSYQDESADDHPKIVAAIQDNNRKMIKQFMTSELGQQIDQDEEAESILDDFLNNYLLTDGIRLVTANLAEANIYFWMAFMSGQPTDLINLTLTNFYAFLSQAGIINRPSAKKIPAFFDDITDTDPTGDELVSTHAVNLEDIFKDDPQFLAENAAGFLRAIDDGELRESFRPVVEQAQEKDRQRKHHIMRSAHTSRIDQTYDIRVSLADFKPEISRIFMINGNQSIADLMDAIIVMFRGQFSHIYDLTDDQTGERYQLPEFVDEDLVDFTGIKPIDARNATISLFKPGDHLTLHYDYGDGWEFKITIRNMFDVDMSGAPRPLVTTAHGYGIIEDIGGTGGLEEYYHDYQHGNVDSDTKEWLGGKLINLDLVSTDVLNRELRNYFRD